jgi:hypothetical protein
MQMIDPKQIQIIHIGKAQLSLDDEAYRAIIAGQTKGKKTSSKYLTYFEADAVINYFVKLGFKIQSNYIRTAGAARRQRWADVYARRKSVQQRPENVIFLASRGQMDMIDALASKISWKFEDGFFRWMKKYMKIDRVITGKQAEAVIEGLKKMLDHQACRDRSPIDPHACPDNPHVSPDNPDDGALGDRALQNENPVDCA